MGVSFFFLSLSLVYLVGLLLLHFGLASVVLVSYDLLLFIAIGLVQVEFALSAYLV